ncbi:MAG: TfoX/Sxy family protein [Mycobacteriales bacterium]
MTYDRELAEHLRAIFDGEADVSEKKMFGGVAFLVDGAMAISASSRGGLMVRVDPADTEDLIASGDASFIEMRGKPMRGWVRVAAERVRSERELKAWCRRGVAAARSSTAAS